MKKIIALLALGLSSVLLAASGSSIAKSLKINPSAKVIKQWEGIFAKKKWKKMFKRADRKTMVAKVKSLSAGDLDNLKSFLVGHAADSAKPAMAGSF